MRKFVLFLNLLFLFTFSNAASADTASNATLVWTKANSPYVINDLITIPEGTTLIVEPGTVIKVRAGVWYPLNIFGNAIIGSQSSSEKVIITSLNDDTVLGDTNGDGNNSYPAKGDIGAFQFSSKNIEIYNTEIRYAGNQSYPAIRQYETNGETINQQNLKIDNLNINNSLGGIYNESGLVSVNNSTFEDITGNVISSRNYGSLNISNSTFNNISGYSIFGRSGKLGLYGNSFLNSGYSPVVVSGSQLISSGNNTGKGGIKVMGGINTSTHLVKDNLPYIFEEVTLPGNTNLVVDPGVIVKFPVGGYYPLNVYGNLIAGSPTSTEKVIFTSLADDSVGGDTNLDGSSTIPLPGDYGTIQFCTDNNSNTSSNSKMDNVDLNYGSFSRNNYSDYAIISGGGSLKLNNIRINNASGGGISARMGETNIDNISFKNVPVSNIYAMWDAAVTVANSKFDKDVVAITNSSSRQVVAINNWWGDTSGPRSVGNASGTGSYVNGNVLYTPWLLNEDGNVGKYSNIMFLPGIMGSDLYNGNDKCWADIVGNAQYDCISMTSLDVPKIQSVKTKEVLNNTYGDFKKEMNKWQTEYGITATAVPYDWRFGIEYIVNNGYDTGDGIDYNIASGTPYLIQKFTELSKTSPSGKVTIIAHSMGGLVTKALTKKLEELGLGNKVDKIIFIGTPQLGTPKATSVFLHGIGGDVKYFKIIDVLSAAEARGLSQNMLSTAELLPSAEYFNKVLDPVILLSATTSIYSSLIQAYGDRINDVNKMDDFMANIKWGKPKYSDLQIPQVVDRGVLTKAKEFHNVYDGWVPPQGSKLITIAGSGLDTISGLDYYSSKTRKVCLEYSGSSCARTGYVDVPVYTVKSTLNGDGTVVSPSAQYKNNDEKYYLNLIDFHHFYGNKYDHASLTEIVEMNRLVKHIISNSTSTEEIKYISTEEPVIKDSDKRLHFILHSPLTLGFKDENGNFSGLSASGTIEEKIPGVQYERIGEIQWMSLPSDIKGNLVMKGTDEGTFDLEVREELNGKILQDTTFVDIPVSTTTNVFMNIDSSDITKAGDMKVDIKGDNTEVINLKPKIGEVVKLKQKITVKPKDKEVILHGTIPSMEYDLVGVSTNTASTTIKGSPICTTNASNTSAIGRYNINCSIGTLSSDEYEFNIATGTLSIIYKFQGFLDPKEKEIFKKGYDVKVKFRLLDAKNVPQQSVSNIYWNTPIRGNMITNKTPIFDNINTTSTKDMFRQGKISKKYKYKWDTKQADKGYWYRIQVNIPDGKSYQTVIGIK